MAIEINGTGTITGISVGGLNDGCVAAADLAEGAALNSISHGANFRNRIINGDMRIDQRNAGAAVTATGSYPIDRFSVVNTTDGAFSAQRSTTVPTGFTNSLYVTTTTADATLTTTQQLVLTQQIEGFNVADLGWGTANAKTVTLSFQVRSSLTGTFGGALKNSATNRSYPFTYSISSANTWEQKSVTIAGDTSGTWLTDNGVGITLAFGLGVGPDRSGTAGAWNSNNNNSATGATSVIGTLNATFYITGVQLEVGSVATPFERRPYGTELQLCQRYYEKTFLGLVQSTRYADTYSTGYWSVEKRASPTLSISIGTGSGATVGVASGNATKAFYQTAANSATSGSTVTGEIEL